MKSKKTRIGIEYELSNDECLRMLEKATDAHKNTYPTRNDGYSACVMTNKGNMYEGASYQTEVEVLTMHGEAVAYAHASIHGETAIVAVTGPNCHCCKQLIYESSLRSGIDTIIVLEEEGVIKQIPISSLMPYPWPEKAGK